MTASTITIKRGDTLPLAGVVTIRNSLNVDVSATTNFALWNISAQVRSGPKVTDTLLATAVIDFIGSTKEFAGTITAAATATFPDKAYLDLRFIDNAGVIQSTQTLVLNVEDAVSVPPV